MFRQTSASECVEGHEEAPRGSLERMESEAEGTRLFNEKETRRGGEERRGEERERTRAGAAAAAAAEADGVPLVCRQARPVSPDRAPY